MTKSTFHPVIWLRSRRESKIKVDSRKQYHIIHTQGSTQNQHKNGQDNVYNRETKLSQKGNKKNESIVKELTSKLI